VLPVSIDALQELLGLAAARAAVIEAAPLLPTVEYDLLAARGAVLAATIRATDDQPADATSALDGFALRVADLAALAPGAALSVAFSIAAGDDPPALPRGVAVGIATGGVVPEGADAVLAVERSVEQDGGVRATDAAALRLGEGIRPAGQDLAEGALVLAEGVTLTPSALAALASLGLPAVPCRRRPRAIVFATGDELVAPGQPRRRGQIYESNSVLVAATLDALGCSVELRPRLPDEAGPTRAALGAAIADADLVITSGGVSVGPRDHVRPSLDALDVQRLFWRIAVQPGKPVWAGRAPSGCLVFGLPGNPLGVLVNLHLLVRPALRALQGADPDADLVTAVLRAPVRRMATRLRAVPAALVGDEATPLGADLSHQLLRAASAHALVLVDAGDGEVSAGERVRCIAL